MNEADYNKLVQASTDYLNVRIERCRQDYKIGEYARYDYDQEKAELVWSDEGIPKVIAKIQFVGSISTKSNTWLWSWENPSVLDNLKKDIVRIRSFGETHGIEKLTNAKWIADEFDGWEMTSIAAKLLEARGAYRAPSSNGFTFMIITEISWAK